jgi:hypothetical protein
LAQIFFSSQVKGGASPQGEPGFDRLRSEFTGCGYELRIEPRLPETLLLKAFRPTGPRLGAVRKEIETRLWKGERAGAANGVAKSGIAGALVQFNRASAWKLSSCGWSRRLSLADGTRVILAMFLAQDERGRLQREAEVLLYPPESADRRILRKVANLCRAAGYEGKLETARPSGGKPFLVAHFDRSPISMAEAAPERARLDALAQDIRWLR